MVLKRSHIYMAQKLHAADSDEQQARAGVHCYCGIGIPKEKNAEC